MYNLLLNSQNKTGDGDTLNEEFSDSCMKNLLGTTSTSNKKCVVNDECWKVMNEYGSTGYTITHQGLFFMLADVLGNVEKLLARLNQNRRIFTIIASSVQHTSFIKF